MASDISEPLTESATLLWRWAAEISAAQEILGRRNFRGAIGPHKFPGAVGPQKFLRPFLPQKFLRPLHRRNF